MKTRLMIMFVLIGALVLSACGGSATPTTTTTSNTPSASTVTKAAPAPVPTKAPAVIATEVPANNPSGNLDLTDVSEGLDTLNSYQTTFTMSFDGTEDNKPKQWNWTTLEEFIKQPAAKHSKISSTNTGAADTTFESWDVNGKNFVQIGDTCIQSDSSAPPTSSNTFTPSSIIGDIRGAQPLGAETVNGIPTQHFSVDVQRFAALGTYTDGKSEVWVATPGNYVVKYFFTATGQDTFFGGGTNSSGTLRWDYEVNNVNQPINIAPPDACGKAAADIPILPDAKNNSAMGDLTTYTSATVFDDAVNFYKTEMVKNGWTADANSSMSAPNFATLSFKKDTRTASVSITFDTSSNETTVLIS
ncbi:MAG TPA: hypothetical protein VFK30_05840, partial [Anaerolineae bacterium]|nr:hypothetical protein [Anaerolineae bacterium]